MRVRGHCRRPRSRLRRSDPLSAPPFPSSAVAQRFLFVLGATFASPFAAAFGAFALAAISYPSGIVAPLIPTLVEGARALAGGMCADVRRELCRRAVPVLAIGMLSIALFVANAVTTNGVISIRTFTESGEGGAVIGTDYGRGAVTAIGAWAGSFWTVLPSTTLGPVNGIIETVSDAPAPRHVPIIARGSLRTDNRREVGKEYFHRRNLRLSEA